MTSLESSVSELSEVDELLRYMLVVDEAELARLERQFAGKIRLGLAGRYGCKLLAAGFLYEFVLWRMPDDHERFVISKSGSILREGDVRHPIYRLIKHRAAEAMLSVRNGHKEYNRRRQAAKAKGGT